MNVQTIIDSYADDVAGRLSPDVRADVAQELRALLSERVREAADRLGRESDSELTLDVLRRFGRPEEVALRYRPTGAPLIEPQLVPLFIKAVVACVAIQWSLTLPRVFTGSLAFSDWLLGWGLGVFWWVGVLVVWFALAGWVRRRSPAETSSFVRPWMQQIFWLPFLRPWRPERIAPVIPQKPASRWKAAILPLIGLAIVVFFAAPNWFMMHVRADADNSWVVYDQSFSRGLLAAIWLVLATRAVLAIISSFRITVSAALEKWRNAFWVISVGLLYWAVLGSPILANTRVDGIFKGWLLAFLIVNTLQVALTGLRATAGVPRTRQLKARPFTE